MMNNTWNEQRKWAMMLQKILGEGYEIRHDACESGMTDCYYKGTLYKRVENTEMKGSLNVHDFRVPEYMMM